MEFHLVLMGAAVGVVAGVFLGRFLAYRQFSRIEHMCAMRAVARRKALATARTQALRAHAVAADLETEDFRRSVATVVLVEPALELAEFRRPVLYFEATPN